MSPPWATLQGEVVWLYDRLIDSRNQTPFLSQIVDLVKSRQGFS